MNHQLLNRRQPEPPVVEPPATEPPVVEPPAEEPREEPSPEELAEPLNALAVIGDDPTIENEIIPHAPITMAYATVILFYVIMLNR